MRIKINNAEERLNGLFSFLFTQYSSHYVYEHIVNVTASSTLSGRGDPTIVINPKADKDDPLENWLSGYEENSNITISFINHLFSIDSYTVQSRQGIENNFPLEWIFEATNDMKEWTTIHYKENGEELISQQKTYHAQCSDKNFFSSFRFTMIGENYHFDKNEKFYFGFGQIEFFGSLFEIKCTLPRREILKVFHFIYLLTLFND